MITEEFVKSLGFYDSGERHAYSTIWRKPIDDHPNPRFFSFVIGNYPETNPNIGVLGIYTPLESVPSVPDDLVSKPEWTEEDTKRAANHTIEIGGDLINFAFYLDDQERLVRLINDILYRR